MRWLRLAGLAGLVLGLALGFGSPGVQAKDGAPLTVFAASSLTQLLDAAVADYRQRGGGEVRVNYAASSALARQIEQAGGADLFISADLDWMNYLEERTLVRPESRTILASNRLVLVAPKGADILGLNAEAPGFGPKLAAKLGTKDRLAMADPDFVPAGRYGKAALSALGAWELVEGRIARAENVRATLLLVARGEAPLGIVYETDAAIEPAVKIITRFPENSHPPILYPAGVISNGDGAGAQAFLAYLSGPQGQAIFARFGFLPKPGGVSP